MYMVQSKPEFSFEVPKSRNIVCPSSVEILRSVSSSLEDSPPSILHIAEDIEWFSTSRVNSVDSIFPAPIQVGLSTVTRCRVRTCRMKQIVLFHLTTFMYSIVLLKYCRLEGVCVCACVCMYLCACVYVLLLIVYLLMY